SKRDWSSDVCSSDLLRSDLGIAAEVTGVAAVEQPVLRTGDHPGGPQGVVAGEGPARKVLGRCCGQPDPGDVDLALPVTFDDPFRSEERRGGKEWGRG